MTASGGAEGVGRAVNQAVVIAFLGIFAFNYAFTQTLLATHPEITTIVEVMASLSERAALGDAEGLDRDLRRDRQVRRRGSSARSSACGCSGSSARRCASRGS